MEHLCYLWIHRYHEVILVCLGFIALFNNAVDPLGKWPADHAVEDVDYPLPRETTAIFLVR